MWLKGTQNMDHSRGPDEWVVYQIRVKGVLDESWSDWTGGMTLTVDEAALHSVLRRLYSLALPLISVHCVKCGSEG
jgi:hypothetical protein